MTSNLGWFDVFGFPIITWNTARPHAKCRTVAFCKYQCPTTIANKIATSGTIFEFDIFPRVWFCRLKNLSCFPGAVFAKNFLLHIIAPVLGNRLLKTENPDQNCFQPGFSRMTYLRVWQLKTRLNNRRYCPLWNTPTNQRLEGLLSSTRGITAPPLPERYFPQFLR